MQLLVHIIILSLALYGTKVTWQEGMIFEKPKLWLDKLFGEAMIRKPLYACPACMPSIWGTLYFWLCTGFTWNMWPVFVLACCGTTWILMYQFPFDD